MGENFGLPLVEQAMQYALKNPSHTEELSHWTSKDYILLRSDQRLDLYFKGFDK